MLNAQVSQKNTCSLLAVLCGKSTDLNQKQDFVKEDGPRYPFPELVSSGRLEVQTLRNPTTDEFQQVLESTRPNIIYLQGQQLPNDEEVGSLVWNGIHLSTAEAICGLFGSTLPDVVYLELPNGEKLAEALCHKGVPYVIYWKNAFSCYSACHFRQTLLSVIQSSCTHTWDAFRLAHASFTLYCVQNNDILPDNCQKASRNLGPVLLGDPPKDSVYPVEKVVNGEIEDDLELSGTQPAIQIHDDDVSLKFLVCGVPSTLDACLFGSLEDGLNALLKIEIRGSKLNTRVSAPPPPLHAGAFSRGVVTMRCDFSTCSSCHVSLLVSGSAQTCFDDQQLENNIKNELLEKSQLVHALPICGESNRSLSVPRTSASIACGSTVYEVCMKVPAWASQVLRQLATKISFRSLAALGIATIQGSCVASFDKDDTERLLFFSTRQERDLLQHAIPSSPPSWLRPPTPSRKRSVSQQETKLHCVASEGKTGAADIYPDNGNGSGSFDFSDVSFLPVRKKLKVAAMRPIPHVLHHKILSFPVISEADKSNGGQLKANSLPFPVPKPKPLGSGPFMHQKSLPNSYQAQQIISLNPLPLKKHGCGRCPIQFCSEEEFLRDVMQFLILRGHTRLVPQCGISEFPDAILNTKRLDLYNLYREVVSRGGFHVGNGINWKGQVFSKMRNHTVTNKMTGVGNTLKKHYEAYLLEYELAHDDVDGECCLLCHSCAAGDWVNCGICGEWAHFGCDRRKGLGAFKDYAKTDGLEYICPQCSITNFSRKPKKSANGYSQASNGL